MFNKMMTGIAFYLADKYLPVKYSADLKWIEICGQQYSYQLFQLLGKDGPFTGKLQFQRDDNGRLTFTRLKEDS